MVKFKEDECTLVGDIPIPRLRRPARHPPTLEQIRGPGAPKLFHINQKDLLIGRAPQSDITIESAALSRQHLRIIASDDEISFLDLDSANGVYLNGVLAHAAVLRDGDLLEFGESAFLFHERGP